MKKIYLVIPLIAILVVAAFAMFAMPGPSVTSTGIGYHSDVCVYKNGIQVGDCTHNTLYNNGKEMVEDLLTNPAANSAILNISLCDADSSLCEIPVAAATEAYEAYDSCGLGNTTGTYYNLGQGNWSIQATFTATSDSCDTNVTRLQNATSSLFAGNSFDHVTLNTDDQLTINWTIWVSEG